MEKNVIGIDVSKEKLDFCLQSGEKILQEFVVENTTVSIKRSLQVILKEYQLEVYDLLVCAEYTGQYTYPLACVCE